MEKYEKVMAASFFNT